MQYVEPVLPERKRECPRVEPPAPSQVAQLVPRGVSNRQLARFLKVQAINWAPQYETPEDSDIGLAAFQTELRASEGFGKAMNVNERRLLGDINAQDLEAPDVPSLADRVIEYLAAGSAQRSQALTRHRRDVEKALAHAAPREVSEAQEQAFQKLMKKATLKSRAKGQPSRITIGALRGNIGTCVSNLRDALQAKNNRLALIEPHIGHPDGGTGAAAGIGLSIRTAHVNLAGWLPVHVAPPVADAAANTWALAMATTDSGPVHVEVIRHYGRAPAGLTARDIEQGPLSTKAKRKWILQGFSTLGRNDRIRHAWREYAAQQMIGCPYIEFNGDQADEISRVVWDYVRDEFYIGMHYNWVKGYNPFIKVDGLTPTI